MGLGCLGLLLLIGGALFLALSFAGIGLGIVAAVFRVTFSIIAGFFRMIFRW